MRNKTFYIQTYGCQMNVADSRKFSEYLLHQGYLPAENLQEAEIIIVNTCTVRQHAEDRALSFIGNLKRLKAKNKNLKIIFAGCAAERLKDNIQKRFPHIDLVIGAKDVEQFDTIFSSINRATTFSLLNRTTTAWQSPDHSPSAFVIITRGCNNFCSYCIVPYVRGPEKYRPVEEIISEIKCLIEQGIKEVTLLGQNVNSYHSILNSNSEMKIDFADLLSEVNKISGLHRIRFLTNHPKDITEKIIDTIAKLPKVCNHIHLPLQSGSDRILQLMNRKYTLNHYITIIDKLRNKIPEISITTDLMVGFPTETEEDFQATYNAVKKIQFDFAYVFKYSVREKTKSAQLGDDVPQQIKEERHKKLLSLCNEIAKEKNLRFINKTVEVLVERKNKDKMLIGKTSCNRTVIFNGPDDLISKIINVKILNTKIHSLGGTIQN